MALETEYKDKIFKILTILFPKGSIILFGSRARGTETESSDIDLAIDEGQPINFARIGEAKAVLEGLYIPYKIDLLDLDTVSKEMKALILKEGIYWKE